MRNPFTAGKWVRGEKFFGRRDVLEKVLHGGRNYVWVAGTRPLGKTSLLKQLEFLSQSAPYATEYIVLLWDLEGSRDLGGLKDGLLESVEAAAERFEAIGIGVDALEALSVFEILRYLERKARNHDLSLMLLCDECEELINIEKSSPEALPRLRRVLQQGENLHTVLTATRRLSLLEHSTLSDTSPFLHGFVPPLYLPRLSDDEARSLIQLGRFKPEDAQVIMEKTYNHPYLVQLVCERLFDGGTLDEVIDDASSDDLVSHFFSVDYDCLDPAERKILLLLLHGQLLDAETLGARIGVASAPMNALLYGLRQLGCIKQVGAGYAISNFFFERWLLRELENLSKALAFDPAASSTVSATATVVIRGLPRPGEILGHHEILEKIGSGGMGAVYKARDLKLMRLVALKVLLPDIMADRRYVERFMREAQAASKLSHPNITTVYEVGEDRGRNFLSMEYVRGRTLRTWRQDDPDNFVAQLGAAIQAGRGLAAAHAHSIVHRDIKPDNIMVSEQDVVKIMDFGLAKLPQEGQSQLTKTGTTFGTTAYMSPEHVRGEPADHRTDIFSFGIVLYELFSGQRPFQGETEISLIHSIMNKEPRSIRELNPGLPEAIESVVARAMRKDKTQRYQRMEDLVTDLEEIRRRLEHEVHLLKTPHSDSYIREKLKKCAIMFTDLVGYSARMNEKEFSVIRMLAEHNQILSSLITRHHGSVVKTIGDSIMAEFDDATDAVTCGAAMQAAIKEYNTTNPHTHRAQIRIGVHYCEVFARGGDLFGTGVNIAARLARAALPETIYVSKDVYDRAKEGSSVRFENLGPMRFKNIDKEIEVFRV